MTNQTCDFEYAAKMKELGYPQGKSYFHYIKILDAELNYTRLELKPRHILQLILPNIDICDAPTAQELLEWLLKAPPGDRDYILTVEKDGEDFNVTWNLWESEGLHHYFKFSILHLANTVAKAVIYLLENKLVDFKIRNKKEGN